MDVNYTSSTDSGQGNQPVFSFPHSDHIPCEGQERYGRPPEIKPQQYSGEEEWDSYISHFELCAELGKWNQDGKLLALCASFTGQARRFYISLPIEERSNYKTVLYKFQEQFGSVRFQSLWLSRLEGRKRGLHESIQALSDDVRMMAQRAYADLDAEAQEMLALNHMYREIDPEMKFHCIFNKCKTVTEAVVMIETYESICWKDRCNSSKQSTVQ